MLFYSADFGQQDTWLIGQDFDCHIGSSGKPVCMGLGLEATNAYLALQGAINDAARALRLDRSIVTDGELGPLTVTLAQDVMNASGVGSGSLLSASDLATNAGAYLRTFAALSGSSGAQSAAKKTMVFPEQAGFVVTGSKKISPWLWAGLAAGIVLTGVGLAKLSQSKSMGRRRRAYA